MLVFIGFIAGCFFICYLLFSSPEDGEHRSDRAMLALFNENENALKQLNKELIVWGNKGLKRIDKDWTDPHDIDTIGMSQETLESYRKRFNALSIPRGVQVTNDSIHYLTYTYGLSIGGTTQKFFYTTRESLQNYYEEDENFKKEPYKVGEKKKFPKKGSYIIYTHIRDGWYIIDEATR